MDQAKRERLRMWFVFGAGIFLAAASPLLLAFAGWRTWQTWDIDKWPTVEGTITKSNVQEGLLVVGRPGRTIEHFDIKIEYSYTVNGKAYTSTRRSVFQTEDTFSPDDARDIATRYAIGKKVAVRYSPRDPSYAVLEIGTNTFQIFMFVFPAVTFVLGVVLIVVGRILRRKLQPNAAPVEPSSPS